MQGLQDLLRWMLYAREERVRDGGQEIPKIERIEVIQESQDDYYSPYDDCYSNPEACKGMFQPGWKFALAPSVETHGSQDNYSQIKSKKKSARSFKHAETRQYT